RPRRSEPRRGGSSGRPPDRGLPRPAPLRPPRRPRRGRLVPRGRDPRGVRGGEARPRPRLRRAALDRPVPAPAPPARARLRRRVARARGLGRDDRPPGFDGARRGTHNEGAGGWTMTGPLIVE